MITAARTSEPEGRIPIDISVVSGKTVADRDAHDIRPRSVSFRASKRLRAVMSSHRAVPAFWGLHEVDVFLLVLDGVPWGGEFNPPIQCRDAAQSAPVLLEDQPKLRVAFQLTAHLDPAAVQIHD